MEKTVITLAVFVMVVSLIVGCVEKPQEEEKLGDMRLLSSAFENGDVLPVRYTCDEIDVSPPLSFVNVPENTKSLVLIMEDTDAPAGVWCHWIVYNISNTTVSLDENAGAKGSMNLPHGAKHGRNSWSDGNDYYRGPCPPAATGLHHYYFRLYAVDIFIDLQPGATKNQVEKTMKGHIIDKAELMTTYGE